MQVLILKRWLATSVCMVAGAMCWAQQKPQSLPSTPLSTDIGATFAVERSQTVPNQCCFWLKGGGADAAVTFWKGLGLAATLNGDRGANVQPGVDVNKLTLLGGPRYTWTRWNHGSAAAQPRFQLFVQGLLGGAHGFNGVYPAPGAVNSAASAFAVQTGGGLNYFLTPHFGLRLIQADYVRTTFPNGADNAQNDLRLSFGVVYHHGAMPQPITLSCSASPASIYAGDSVTVTSTAGNLDPRLNVVYAWSGKGVTGSGSTAQVATGDLASGTYTLKGQVKEGKKDHEGLKAGQSAECSASFIVKPFEPPMVSCSANPATIKPGETSTIAATGVSPQNRPLTYSYTAASGSIAGTGATALYSSTGAPTGTVNINCSVSDDKGQSATAATTVTITAPYVPPPPHTEALCSISFTKDKRRPTRVDNEAKACLDEVALDLQKQPDAKAVIVGNATSAEKMPPKHARKYAQPVDFAGERAVNAKNYLVREKGIDASRIGVATGTADSQTAENYLVSSGANFAADVSGTTPVDESTVKPEMRKPLPERKHHPARKAAAK